MPRFHQLLFTASLLALSWLLMMALHELGHVLGALLTGGNIEQVVLHPLKISQTLVIPNPHPAIVVWLGPIVGCLLPLLLFVLLPSNKKTLKYIAQFFAGFCLLANGTYIALGSINRIGDSGEMLRTGSPQWSLLAFGFATIPPALYLWHQLGSLKSFIQDTSFVSPKMAYSTAGALFGLIAFLCLIFS